MSEPIPPIVQTVGDPVPFSVKLFPGQWLWPHIYRPAPLVHPEQTIVKYGLYVAGDALSAFKMLPDCVCPNRSGDYSLMGRKSPTVACDKGWEWLELKLRERAATNRSPDDIFDDPEVMGMVIHGSVVRLESPNPRITHSTILDEIYIVT